MQTFFMMTGNPKVHVLDEAALIHFRSLGQQKKLKSQVDMWPQSFKSQVSDIILNLYN